MSLTSVLKGNVSDYSREPLPLECIQDQSEGACFSPQVSGVRHLFALMIGTEDLEKHKKLPRYSVSLERTCLFYEKSFFELGIYTP